MGFIRKVVGDLTGANAAAKATTQAAEVQANAVRDAATQTAKANQEAAAQTAKQQELAAARIAAQGAAADAIATPAATPEVQLTATPVETSTAAAKKRRAAFGTGSVDIGVVI